MNHKVEQPEQNLPCQRTETQKARPPKKGFASLAKGHLHEIASKGGRAAHEKGTAHEFNSEEARSAGRKGGFAVSRNREHMAAIGRMGGAKRQAGRLGALRNGLAK
ncbi:MAG: stress-induced bacterial acidophilic repeat motif family protein [Pseudomonadota bacterium]